MHCITLKRITTAAACLAALAFTAGCGDRAQNDQEAGSSHSDAKGQDHVEAPAKDPMGGPPTGGSSAAGPSGSGQSGQSNPPPPSSPPPSGTNNP